MTRSEAIIAARQMKTAGEFQRKISHRIPVDLQYDRFDLACGHHILLMPALVRDTAEALDCGECIENWLRTRSESESPEDNCSQERRSSMPGSPRDDVQWEKVWREADDEFLIESAKDHLWQNLQSPRPGFARFAQICCEAHRRGKPELLMHAVQRLVPIRTASGEDLRVLLRALERLMSTIIPAGQEIVKLSGEENAALLELMRECLKEAREAMARFAHTRRDQ